MGIRKRHLLPMPRLDRLLVLQCLRLVNYGEATYKQH